MTTNQERAAEIIAETVGGKMLTQAAAEALAEAGLIAPDLPAPDLTRADPEHRAEFEAYWDGPVPNIWNKGLPVGPTVQTCPGERSVTLYDEFESWETFTPEEARSLADALRAAADYAEEEA